MTDAEQSTVFFAEGGGQTWQAKAIHLEESNRTLISTIRELREEKAARDRVVEAARAYCDQMMLQDYIAQCKAWDELKAALAALEEQS